MENSIYEKKYIYQNAFESTEKNGSIILIDYGNGNWFKTDEAGYGLIKECDGEKTLLEIIENKSSQWEVDSSLICEEFLYFFQEAIKVGIIQTNTDEQQDNEDQLEEYPSEIWIHVSNVCNLNCQFCYSNSGESSLGSLTLEKSQIINFLRQIPEKYRELIVLSGGEPLLYSDLIPLVNELKNIGYEDINIITNGTVGEEKYSELLPLVESIQISIDGTSSQIHDSSRQKGSFEKILRNIKMIKRIGVKDLRISFTPTASNVDDLPNIPQFAVENGIDSIHVTRLMPIGRGLDNNDALIINEDILEEKLGLFIKNLREINDKVYYKRELTESLLPEEDKTKYLGASIAGSQYEKIVFAGKRKSCGAGVGMISINYNGIVYPCASLHKDEYALADIESDKIETLLDNGEKYDNEVNVDNKKTICFNCKEKYLCGGGCRACADAIGDIYGEDPSCASYRESIIEAIATVDI